jgi:hypothetical protein
MGEPLGGGGGAVHEMYIDRVTKIWLPAACYRTVAGTCSQICINVRSGILLFAPDKLWSSSTQWITLLGRCWVQQSVMQVSGAGGC